VMFHLCGGCCDGSAPMCFRRGKVKWIPIPIPKTRTDAKGAPRLGVQRLLVSRTHQTMARGGITASCLGSGRGTQEHVCYGGLSSAVR
jgi:hypothetical protein